MDAHLLEELLNEEESSALDFKREQYPFEAAPDEQKAELLKDVLAFANAWRRTDAYILIGVEEVRGSRSRPLGVAEHLDDAKLQQFVNSKTQKPIQFAYRVQRVQGVEIGVIWMPVQDRPFFLKKDFGKLTRNTVYIRQGSATSTADPDEVARIAIAGTMATPAQLTATSRVLNAYKGAFVVSISNLANSGDARAPYLELRPPGPFMLSAHGLDGTSRQHGLPLLPQGEGSTRLQFAGTADVILHPGTSRDIAVIDWHGAHENVPPNVEVPYVVAAEGIPAATGTLAVKLAAG